MTPTVPLYPLRFQPILRRLIWGGRRLGTVLHKPIGDEADYAESWELSDYHDQVSVVEEGPWPARRSASWFSSRGRSCSGRRLARATSFRSWSSSSTLTRLSRFRSTPTTRQAGRLANDNGKTETWVILDAEPGSLIYAGLKAGVGRDEFAEAIEIGHGREPAAPFRAQARRLHPDRGRHGARDRRRRAAGRDPGDVGRDVPGLTTGDAWATDGKPRPLHIQQAMESIDFGRGPVDPISPEVEPIAGGGTRERLARSPYFALERLQTRSADVRGTIRPIHDPDGLEGSCRRRARRRTRAARFRPDAVAPGRRLGQCEISPRGEATVLTCVVPDSRASPTNVHRSRPENSGRPGRERRTEDDVADEASMSGSAFPGPACSPRCGLVGAIRLAFDLRKLVIAALGLVLLQLGWSILDRLLSARLGRDARASSTASGSASTGRASTGLGSCRTARATSRPALGAVPAVDSTPLFALLDPAASWGRMLHALLSLIWLIVVWGICGGAIARIAIVQVAKMRQTGIVEALRFALRSAGAADPGSALSVARPGVFCGHCRAAFGLLYRLPVVGPPLWRRLSVHSARRWDW